MTYDLLQAQTDVASLRGQFAHLLATAEIINMKIDGTLTLANGITLADITLPATPVSAVTLYADSTSGRLTELVPSTRHAPLSDGSGNTSAITVTAASSTAITTAWSFPANDANTGTCYRVRAGGWGTWGATQQTLGVGCGKNGSLVRTETIAAAAFVASAGFEWVSTYCLTILGTGVSGHCWLSQEITLSRVGGSHGTEQITIHAGSNGASTGEAIDTTASNDMEIMMAWGSTTGAPTITCTWSTFERIG